ncbi:putative arylsulfatase regulatory protein [Vibrio ponticus]|nr:putative arylsulfatase regulatory protein [Vibrio ponticus]
MSIANDLQTNGTLLTDEWCQFLKQHNFLVGLSIDGPEMLHNAYRTNKAGRGTFKQVMKAVELLHKHQVNFATLTCVNNLTSCNPLEVYRFLRDEVRSPQMQFIPIVEQKSFRSTAPQTWSATEQLKQGDKRLIPGNKDSIMELGACPIKRGVISLSRYLMNGLQMTSVRSSFSILKRVSSVGSGVRTRFAH